MLRFLSNTHDPKDPHAKMYVARSFNQTQENEWLKGKIIGKPQATSTYTVEELEKMGMVGVYIEE